jgi:hypothetical protein
MVILVFMFDHSGSMSSTKPGFFGFIGNRLRLKFGFKVPRRMRAGAVER